RNGTERLGEFVRFEGHSYRKEGVKLFAVQPSFSFLHSGIRWRSVGVFEGLREVRKGRNRGKSRWSSWWCCRQHSSCGTKPDGLPVRPASFRPARCRGSRLAL